ncbi:MAG: hypothetical protein RI947_724 [Candidatus Parcubacteria bacterium]|jgi:phosphoribosylanthranilate isomerase
MLVKICGLSNSIDAMNAVAAGADALGFVMGGWVLPPEVEPHAQTVRMIIKQLPSTVDSYIVTHLLEAEDIVSLANYVQSTGIQISEDLPVEKLRAIRSKTDKKIVKTVIVRDAASVKRLKEVEPYCDFILLDTQIAGYVGGTGKTSDWELCRTMVRSAKKPVFLAGGLNPKNVKEAIQQVNPQGVDVSTGVSTYSLEYLRKDRKDPEKINSFISLSKNI